MQLINAITFLAASVAAAPAFDTFVRFDFLQQPLLAVFFATPAPLFSSNCCQKGIRYTDHQCKTLHSQPNRDFPRNVCIDLYTVK